ncbi:MAG TPA: DUF1223 domain-containing protein [Vicinamibacterales bacterium]|nr:DUF1223 domain-containing protein [Vicinamibacterales bacterium]
MGSARSVGLLAVATAIGLLGASRMRALVTPAASTFAAARVPIVVELFTSEGCSSCPPADTLLERLLDTQPLAGAQVIGLGEHVDYWDRLGWKDRFSSAALTKRQQVYGARFNTEDIYTPQMVVDGRTELVGSDASAARRALERAAGTPHGSVQIVAHDIDKAVTPGRSVLDVSVTTSDLPKISGGDRADVVIAVTEDHLRSEVTRGENHGRVLTHAAVVRYLTTIGEAPSGTASTARAEVPIAPDWQRAQLKVVAFVQERRGRAIVASAVLPVDRR